MSRIASATSLWIDGRPADAAMLSALQTNYGHLSTMQVRSAAVRGFGRHLARLQAANVELFGSALTAARIQRELASALRAASVDDATLRVSVGALDVAAVELGDAVEVTLLVALSPPRAAPTTPQRLQSCRHQRPLAHLKHLATLPLLHARRTARAAGFDDALLVDDAGGVLEGAFWNVGFVDAEGGVVWPDGDALPGITRGLLYAGLEAGRASQRITRIELAACAEFQSAFACNSSGLWPLASIDGRAFAGEPVVPDTLQRVLAGLSWDPVAA